MSFEELKALLDEALKLVMERIRTGKSLKYILAWDSWINAINEYYQSVAERIVTSSVEERAGLKANCDSIDAAIGEIYQKMSGYIYEHQYQYEDDGTDEMLEKLKEDVDVQTGMLKFLGWVQ
jgi:hypothetical protein